MESSFHVQRCFVGGGGGGGRTGEVFLGTAEGCLALGFATRRSGVVYVSLVGCSSMFSRVVCSPTSVHARASLAPAPQIAASPEVSHFDVMLCPSRHPDNRRLPASLICIRSTLSRPVLPVPRVILSSGDVCLRSIYSVLKKLSPPLF